MTDLASGTIYLTTFSPIGSARRGKNAEPARFVALSALLTWSITDHSDHGTFNSYNRNAYLTTIRDGSPSFTPADTYIYSNVWLCSYFSGWALDHDGKLCARPRYVCNTRRVDTVS